VQTAIEDLETVILGSAALQLACYRPPTAREPMGSANCLTWSPRAFLSGAAWNLTIPFAPSSVDGYLIDQPFVIGDAVTGPADQVTATAVRWLLFLNSSSPRSPDARASEAIGALRSDVSVFVKSSTFLSAYVVSDSDTGLQLLTGYDDDVPTVWGSLIMISVLFLIVSVYRQPQEWISATVSALSLPVSLAAAWGISCYMYADGNVLSTSMGVSCLWVGAIIGVHHRHLLMTALARKIAGERNVETVAVEFMPGIVLEVIILGCLLSIAAGVVSSVALGTMLVTAACSVWIDHLFLWLLVVPFLAPSDGTPYAAVAEENVRLVRARQDTNASMASDLDTSQLSTTSVSESAGLLGATGNAGLRRTVMENTWLSSLLEAFMGLSAWARFVVGLLLVGAVLAVVGVGLIGMVIVPDGSTPEGPLLPDSAAAGAALTIATSAFSSWTVDVSVSVPVSMLNEVNGSAAIGWAFSAMASSSSLGGAANVRDWFHDPEFASACNDTCFSGGNVTVPLLTDSVCVECLHGFVVSGNTYVADVVFAGDSGVNRQIAALKLGARSTSSLSSSWQAQSSLQGDLRSALDDANVDTEEVYVSVLGLGNDWIAWNSAARQLIVWVGAGMAGVFLGLLAVLEPVSVAVVAIEFAGPVIASAGVLLSFGYEVLWTPAGALALVCVLPIAASLVVPAAVYHSWLMAPRGKGPVDPRLSYGSAHAASSLVPAVLAGLSLTVLQACTSPTLRALWQSIDVALAYGLLVRVCVTLPGLILTARDPTKGVKTA
jgi:hypothetical protein